MILQQHHLTTTSRTVPLVPAPLMPGRKRVVTFGSVTEIMEDSCCNWRKNDGPSSSATPNDHSVLPRVPDSPTRGNNPLCIQRHHHEAPAHRFVSMNNSEASMELAHLWGSNSSMDNPVTEQDSLRKKRGGRRRRNHVSGQSTQQQPPEEPEGALSSSSRHRNKNHPESPTAQSPAERRNARNTSGILPEVLHNHQHRHSQNTSLRTINTTNNINNHGNSMNSSIHWDSWQAELNDDHEGGGFHNSSSSQNDHNTNNNNHDKSLQFSNVFLDGSSENLFLGSFLDSGHDSSSVSLSSSSFMMGPAALSPNQRRKLKLSSNKTARTTTSHDDDDDETSSSSSEAPLLLGKHHLQQTVDASSSPHNTDIPLHFSDDFSDDDDEDDYSSNRPQPTSTRNEDSVEHSEASPIADDRLLSSLVISAPQQLHNRNPSEEEECSENCTDEETEQSTTMPHKDCGSLKQHEDSPTPNHPRTPPRLRREPQVLFSSTSQEQQRPSKPPLSNSTLPLWADSNHTTDTHGSEDFLLFADTE